MVHEITTTQVGGMNQNGMYQADHIAFRPAFGGHYWRSACFKEQSPQLEGNLPATQVKAEGQEALFTCIARNLQNNTVIWKYGADKILTAGTVRVTQKQNIQVLHDEGGNVYVLSISNLTPHDSGLYVCEINSTPPTRTFHKLTVLSSNLSVPHEIRAVNTSMDVWGFSTPSPIAHDYSSCCVGLGVSSQCLGFCNIRNILEGKAGSNPAECEKDFPNIVLCMADGKNHAPCCQEAQVPDICQDMCSGKYNQRTDSLKTHLSCSAFTAPTLACIAKGISILPGRPVELEATDLSSTSFTLKWLPATTTASELTQDYFQITLETLGEMNHKNLKNALPMPQLRPSESFKVPGNVFEYAMEALTPFTLYNATVTALNQHGESLPSYNLLILTHTKGESMWTQAQGKALPDLPDFKQCCLSKNITHTSCADTFCDFEKVQNVSVPDLMVCAPWTGSMFDCLFDGQDHTQCCQDNGLPDVCLGFCNGSIKTVDFSHFKCMKYMAQISQCIMKQHNVLSTAPRDFRFSNIGSNTGLIHWNTPRINGEHVQSYLVHYREMMPRNLGEEVIQSTEHTVYILEDLVPDTSYEVYVEPVNQYGIGESSTRIVFKTATSPDDSQDEAEDTYESHQRCCIASGVRSLPLCSYNVTMTEVRSLAKLCVSELSRLTTCAAGGKDHMPCCARRGVPTECQPLCQGIQPSPGTSTMDKCLSYAGNILTCLEEGSLSLPEPVHNFHTTFLGKGVVAFEWEHPNTTEDVSQFELYYKKLYNNSNTEHIFTENENINATGLTQTITDLDTDARYQFFIISRNPWGTSLPSSLITLNMSGEATKTVMEGVATAPHSVIVTKKGPDFLSLTWTNPTISHPLDYLRYVVYYRSLTNTGENVTHSVETPFNAMQITKLNPNTQYIIFLTTKTMAGESEPSETLIVWTNPIIPAYAEVTPTTRQLIALVLILSNFLFFQAPTIHPKEGILEGDSVSVLCIGMGSPTPNLTLYIAGHPIRMTQGRHMATTVHNISRHMDRVACHADNGFGSPMLSSRQIAIGRQPSFTSHPPGSIQAKEGQPLLLEFHLDASPHAQIRIGREGVSMKMTERFAVQVIQDPNDRFASKAVINITSCLPIDSGDYYIHANNSVGSLVHEFTLRINANIPQTEDSKSCCQRLNVTEECQPLCSLNLDLDFLIARPQCFAEFDKLMHCAADGSDHRHCCSMAGVPSACLDWCRGIEVHEDEFCALTHARDIHNCFGEGKYTLPGAPRNIKVTPISADSAKANWDPPTKNPTAVELYRVLYRKKGERFAEKIDTPETEITISNLTPGVTYELVVKAGNSNGTSQLSAPLQFFTANHYLVETTQIYSPVPSIVGVLVAVCLLVPLAMFAIWYVKTHKTVSRSSSTAGSFDNPFFNQEIYMNQIGDDQDPAPSMTVPRPEPHQPQNLEDTECDPTFYEEVKLGKKGEGFKRLK
eukprot:maker-scaffold22_size673200-snap-gene-3.19 protein:Tk12676 transcript:maker-scaffold22_size673200-snap-gene-3.19-mRNA-1 annotation:"ig-like and fibronectin type-iii domain-containing protein"